MVRIQRGDGHPTWGAVWLDLGRLRLIWCVPKHPNRWMILWRRGLSEWDPKTKWAGSETPGPFWRSCDARLQRKRGVDPADAPCRFPKCECWRHLPKSRREEWDHRRQEWERAQAESAAYVQRWKATLDD